MNVTNVIEDEPALIIGALASLVREQALAIEGDRPEAVAFVTGEIEALMARLSCLESGLSASWAASEPELRLELDRLARALGCAQAQLRLALERLSFRRAFLARMGVIWYGARPRQPARRNSFALSA
jgi:hypothetical protein